MWARLELELNSFTGLNKLEERKFNQFGKVGISYKEVESSLREHFSLVARGEVTESAGYPQVRLS